MDQWLYAGPSPLTVAGAAPDWPLDFAVGVTGFPDFGAVTLTRLHRPGQSGK
jgi:hypothetical protein